MSSTTFDTRTIKLHDDSRVNVYYDATRELSRDAHTRAIAISYAMRERDEYARDVTHATLTCMCDVCTRVVNANTITFFARARRDDVAMCHTCTRIYRQSLSHT